MSSNDGDLYIMHAGNGDGEWMSPVPARQAIVEAIGDESDLDADDLDLDESVDWDELRAVLEGDGAGVVEFQVDDHSVTVDADGEIDVE